MPSYFHRDVVVNSATSLYAPLNHHHNHHQQQTNSPITSSLKVSGLVEHQIIENNCVTSRLNVNGKKFYRNKEKTIWSYNPDDFLIRVRFFILKVKQCSLNQTFKSH